MGDWNSRRRILGELALTYGGTLLLAKGLYELRHIPLVASCLHGIVAVAFLYIPTILLRRAKVNPDTYGLKLDKPLRLFLLMAASLLLVFPPFFLGYDLYQRLFFHNSFHFLLPPDLLTLSVFHLAVVALPEEVFYRGYLQGRLNDLFPRRFKLFTAEVGPGLLLASALFALGHLAVDGRLQRLGVFFPALIFGWMREHSGSVAWPVGFHASCNIYMAILERSYFS